MSIYTDHLFTLNEGVIDSVKKFGKKYTIFGSKDWAKRLAARSAGGIGGYLASNAISKKLGIKHNPGKALGAFIGVNAGDLLYDKFKKK